MNASEDEVSESESESDGELATMEKRKLNKSRVSDAHEETPVLESHFEEASENVKRWLDFCRSHALVKCVEYDVPTGILPKGYTGVLIDVKVGGKKRVPDDKIYLAHKELRQKVARGNCVLELNTLERGKICRTTYIFLVFALKKFSGGMGDDDDSQNSKLEWLHYFLKPLEKAHKIISTEKCNGEAAHISAVKLLGSTYFCIGSKNVHMLARNAGDTEKYKDARFQIASVVSKTFFQTFMDNPDITEKQKKSFVTFVQENSYTAVAEILQPTHQHVVNLSYLQHPELRFICWTKADVDEDFSSSSTLCPMAINEAIDKAREFGLQTCDYELVNIGGNLVEKIERYMQKIRKDHGHEGRVLYFLDEHNYTIGLIKKKTAWYIILRAVREKLASFSGYDKKLSVSERDAKIRKRIKEIQIWLEFSDSYADKWIEISCALARWTFSQTITDNIRCTFPLIFQTFLEQNSNFRAKYDALLSDHEELFG